MAPRATRRSRPPDLDDEESRPNTPNSTAPHDGKRIRRRVNHVEDDEHVSSTEQGFVPQSIQNLLAGGGDAHLETEFRPGAIIRVKLTNFVTYTSAEFVPGPYLNMVIGPNGTGKSTLVCAICLGLGWSPTYLGRAKEPAEFVKHGAHKAIIEIELQRSSEHPKNIYVQRIIERGGNQSKFFLNGERSSGAEVKRMAGDFNIQIDNLCQFLPQDKVVEFAQMTPIELLNSTQRAVADPDMIRWHEDLKQYRSELEGVMTEDRDARAQLANLESRQTMQITEVERMKERAVITKRLADLEKFRPVVQCQQARKNRNTLKEKFKALSTDLKRLQTMAEPLSRMVDAKKDYEVKAQAYKEACEKELAAAHRECERRSRVVDERREVINGIVNEIQAEKKTVPDNKSKIQREQTKLQDLQRKKAEVPEAFDPRAINEEIQKLRTDLRALDDQRSDLDSRKAELADRADRSNRKFQTLRNQLAGLETQVGQQEGKLETLSRDTSKAWRWIQDHRNEFSAHVYGPPLVECSLKDPRMADAVESFMSANDFKFITLQNQADFTLLQEQVFKNLKLHDVSLRVCPSDSLEEFPPPLTGEAMERLGLSGWALDHLQGPRTVLAQIAAERNLHKCAISSRELGQQQHDELVSLPAISSYAAGRKTYFFSRRPEYGPAGTSARVTDMRPARMWTQQPVDAGRQAALKREINEVRDEQNMLKAEAQDIDNEIGKVEGDRLSVQRKIEAKQQEKAAKQRALSEWNALDPKIQNHKDKIRNLSEALRGVRARLDQLNARHDAALLDVAKAVLDFAPASRDMTSKIKRLKEAQVFQAEANSDHERLNRLFHTTRQRIQEKKDEADSTGRSLVQENERYKSCKKASAGLENEAQRAAADGDRSLVELRQEVTEKFSTEEELDMEIDSEKARLEFTEGGNVDVIAEFEKRARDIELLKSKLEAADRKREEKRGAIKEIRGPWESRLESIVASINEAFSASFARIGCAGQVALHKASSKYPADCTEENGGVENGLDFANWAIHIIVKFRDQEPLKLLDSHRQSGGERAVSTILYLMALQSLSGAPFRVVDEINQGMDLEYERMVHRRIVDVSEDSPGQYFLITPKLLDRLTYEPGITVLMIFSGENIPAAGDAATPFHLRGLVDKKRQMDLADAAEGRTIDLGARLGKSPAAGA